MKVRKTMKQISAKNVFIVNAWMKQETGKKMRDLPPFSKLDDGRYKCELYIPTADVLIACAAKDKISALEHLFEKAVKEIKKYCSNNGLNVPETFFEDQMLISEVDGELEWLINPKYKNR